MKRVEIADYLRRVLDVRDVAAWYGLTVDARGWAKCPFHAEKTGSFRVYKDGFKCFGCGAHGDAIDLTMRLTGRDFWRAASEINHDFGLGLPLSGQPSPGIARKSSQIQAARDAERVEIQRISCAYWGAYDRWLMCDRLMREADPYSVRWRWAVNRIDLARFDLDTWDDRMKGMRKKHV